MANRAKAWFFRERCFRCKDEKTFRAVLRYGEYVYFCRACDEELEEDSWLFWYEKGFSFGEAAAQLESDVHLGLFWRPRTQRIVNSFRGRLRWMLYVQTRVVDMRFLDVLDAARRIGDSPRDVLKKVAIHEGHYGRKIVGHAGRAAPKQISSPKGRRT